MTKLNMSEQEQVMQIKDFFIKYGKYFGVLLVVVIVVYLFSIFNNMSSQKKSIEAATIYASFVSAQTANNDTSALTIVKQLQNDFSGTEYATEASFLYADTAFKNNKLDVASQMLNWILSNSKDKGYIDLARLRLANVYIDQKNFDGALKLLQETHDQAFDGLYYLARGDLYIAQGNNSKARDAYKEALEKSGQDSNLAQVIQMRMQVLGQ